MKYKKMNFINHSDCMLYGHEVFNITEDYLLWYEGTLVHIAQ